MLHALLVHGSFITPIVPNATGLCKDGANNRQHKHGFVIPIHFRDGPMRRRYVGIMAQNKRPPTPTVHVGEGLWIVWCAERYIVTFFRLHLFEVGGAILPLPLDNKATEWHRDFRQMVRTLGTTHGLRPGTRRPVDKNSALAVCVYVE